MKVILASGFAWMELHFEKYHQDCRTSCKVPFLPCFSKGQQSLQINDRFAFALEKVGFCWKNIFFQTLMTDIHSRFISLDIILDITGKFLKDREKGISCSVVFALVFSFFYWLFTHLCLESTAAAFVCLSAPLLLLCLLPPILQDKFTRAIATEPEEGQT